MDSVNDKYFSVWVKQHIVNNNSEIQSKTLYINKNGISIELNSSEVKKLREALKVF